MQFRNFPAFDPPREWVPAAPPKPVETPRLPASKPSAGGRAFAGVAGFAAGTAVGIFGVLAWQGRFTAAAPVETAAVTTPAGVTPPLAVKPVEVAPLPREVSPAVPEPATPTPEPTPPAPPVVGQAAPPAVAEAVRPAPALPAVVPAAVPVVVKAAGKAVEIEVNQPEGEYTLAVPMQKGEHVILKGKVGKLKLGSIEAGSTLDATQLEAGAITVNGKIDGGSKVKLNAPHGTVIVTGKVDGGSQLTITGWVIYLNSGVGGAKTRVTAIISRSGSLRSVGVDGTAVLEYRAASGGWSNPDVFIAGPVAGGATVRKIEEK